MNQSNNPHNSQIPNYPNNFQGTSNSFAPWTTPSNPYPQQMPAQMMPFNMLQSPAQNGMPMGFPQNPQMHPMNGFNQSQAAHFNLPPQYQSTQIPNNTATTSQSVAVYSSAEKVDPSAKAASTQKTAPLDYAPRVKGKWVEYKTDGGDLYYYNSLEKTTQWELPPEFKADEAAAIPKKEKEATSAQTAVASHTPTPSDSSTPSAKPKTGNAKKSAKPSPQAQNESSAFSTYSLLSHEECVAMFKALLREQEIAHDAEWAGILSDIIKDSRYSAIKTLGERKKLFAKHCEEQRDAYERQRKAETERRMKAFYKMLEESGGVDLHTKFSKLEEKFGGDERFSSLEYIEKRNLFSKFREELRRRQKKKEDDAYRKYAPLFEEALQKSGKVSAKATWEEVKAHFESEECCKKLRSKDRERLFRKQRTRSQRSARREREAARERAKKQQRKLRRLLDDLAFGKTLFHSKSSWEEVKGLAELTADESFKYFAESESKKLQEVPFKLFERFCCELCDKLSKEKEELKRFLRKKRKRVSVDDKVEKLFKSFKDDAEKPRLKDSHLKILFLEMIAKVQHKQAQRTEPSKMSADLK